MVYTTIIVGAGIAGLYYSYLLKKNGVSDFIVLESEDKYGGRVGIDNFHGVDVVTGAGIGRFDKDRLLIQLMNELKIEYKTYTTDIDYNLSIKKINILEKIEKLKTIVTGEDRKRDFKTFLVNKLGEEGAYKFILSSGYTDYVDADVIDTLYDYGFEDNVPGYTAIKIPCKELLDSLYNYIGKEKFRMKTRLSFIKKRNGLYLLSCHKNGKKIEYKCSKLILAIPPMPVYKLTKKNIYREFGKNTFMRTYALLDKKISGEFIQKIDKFTFVDPPIQKIIPMNRDKGVYMLSYSDNKSANWIEKYKNTPYILENLIKNYTGLSIKILDIKTYYWKTGTHYYKPLKSKWYNRDEFIDVAQNPVYNVYVIGEAYTKNQGWVEGALESVEKIFLRSRMF